MSFMCPHLTRLKRPKILVDAARHGSQLYVRRKHLGKLLGGRHYRSHSQLLDALSQYEFGLDQDRRDKAETYSVRRHIEVLSALMAESTASEAF